MENTTILRCKTDKLLVPTPNQKPTLLTYLIKDPSEAVLSDVYWCNTYTCLDIGDRIFATIQNPKEVLQAEIIIVDVNKQCKQKLGDLENPVKIWVKEVIDLKERLEEWQPQNVKEKAKEKAKVNSGK